mgnify:CR=1 FL=1
MKTPLELIVIKLFDLHCDTLTECFEKNICLSDMSLAVNLTGARVFERYIQSFAIWISEKEKQPFEKYERVLNYGKRILKDGGFSVCSSASEIDASLKKGIPIALLSLEGATPIESVEQVDRLYSDGVRTVSLTWNYNNRLAGGALDDGALTELGRDVIRRMNRLGMVLDLSHLNRKSFYEAVSLADNVVATHTGLSETIDCPRNLDLQQLKLIKEKKGLIGLCFYPEFIGTPVTKGFKKAVYELVNRGFENEMAIGSDFDGAAMHEELSSLTDVPKLYDVLISCGLSKQYAEKLTFNNSFAFYRSVLTN